MKILILTLLFLDSDKSRSHSYGVYLSLEGRSSVAVLLFYLFMRLSFHMWRLFCHSLLL